MQTNYAWSGAYPVTVAGIVWNCVFIYVILMPFTLSTIGVCLTWRSQENSPAVSQLSFFLRTLLMYRFAVLLYFSLSSLCPWNSHSCELPSVSSKRPFFFLFFVRSNALSKCVNVDVYPTAGQCQASKYAIVTVHVLQQHSADCLEVNSYVTLPARPARPFTYKRLTRPTK